MATEEREGREEKEEKEKKEKKFFLSAFSHTKKTFSPSDAISFFEHLIISFIWKLSLFGNGE